MISKGFFVIADITGYTEFLTQSGLEEAQGILDHLFNGFLEAIKEPLIISNFQGDAVLAYAPDGSFRHGQTLFESLENIYFTFTGLVEQMERTAACSCDACDNLPKLDLKLIVHHGAFAVQNIRGREELTGADVILAHRMLKNNVREKTGLKSYALFSEAAIDKLELDAKEFGMLEIHGEYEHLGSVRMLVHDLRKEYEKRREQQRVFVRPDQAAIFLEKTLPVIPPIAWEYLTLPMHLKDWMTFEIMSNLDQNSGKFARGTVFQCVRKTDRTDYVITDWRPFDYLTVESTLQGIAYQTTYSLMRKADSTLLRCYCRPLQTNATSEAVDTMRMTFETNLGKLKNLVQNHLQAQAIH